jgi:serine/threonine protein kinase
MGYQYDESRLNGILISHDYLFYPTQQLGSGSFGHVYLGKKLKDNLIIAIKVEKKVKDEDSMLKLEYIILKHINNEYSSLGFPYAYHFIESDNYKFLITTVLGKNLYELLKLCNGKFSVKTTIMIGIQMIDRIEQLHKSHYVHRDIKPENFLIGVNEHRDIIHLIDFGLSKKYRSSKTLEHRKIDTNSSPVGTLRYMSINTLQRIEQSRRDDMESIGYILIYFLNGRLPWQGLNISNKRKRYSKILRKKRRISTHKLCSGLPICIFTYMKYVKSLKYDDDISYNCLRTLFINEMHERNICYDCSWDWLNKL